MSITETAARWLDRAAYPLAAGLIVGPAFLIPRFLDEAPKIGTETVVVFAAWALVVGIGAARALGGKAFLGGGGDSWFRRLMIAFAAYLVLAGVWCEQPSTHWAYAASVLALLLAGQSLIGWIEDRPGRRNYVYGLLAALLTTEALFGLLQFARVPLKPLTAHVVRGGWADGLLTALGAHLRRPEVIGTLGNPNYLSELLVVLMGATTGWALARHRLGTRAALLIPPLAGLAVVFAASTRSAVVGLAGGALIAAAVTGAWRQVDLRAWWGEPRRRVALIVGVIAVIGVAGVAGGRLAQKFGGTFENDFSVESRLVNWRAAGALWAQKPIQGHGLGGWKRESVAMLSQQNPAGLPESSSQSRFLQVHNEPLQGLVELGLLGVVLALAALFAWCLELRRNPLLALPERFGLIMGVFALLIAAEFGFPFHVPLTAMAFVIVVALGATRGPTPAAVEGEAAATASGTDIAPPARWAYALAVVLLTGTVAKVMVERGVLPAYHASLYQLLGKESKKANRKAPGYDLLFGYAAEIDRFKATHAFDQMSALAAHNRWADMVAVYDRYQNDALPMSARLLRARALIELGRKEEAKADYIAVAHYYYRAEKNYRIAYRALRKLGVTDLPPPERRQRPDVLKPVPRPSAVATTEPTDVPAADDDATGDKDDAGEADKVDGASS